MKLVKSLLLGTTAMVAAAGAQAADLPVRQAAVVENVCANLGSGYAGAWVMPGTDTCVQLSGYVRGEYFIRDRESRIQDLTGFRAEGRLNFDIRHASDIGVIRGYVRLVGTTASNFAAAGFGATGAINTVGQGGIGGFAGGPIANVNGTILDAGFVEIQNAAGQFVAGRATNNFNPGPGGDRYTGARFRDGTRNEQFAYTFGLQQFGLQGFSVTFAVENPVRVNTFNFIPATGATGINGQFATFGSVAGIPNVYGLSYAGVEAPDFIGRLQATGSWGTAWLSGAVHQISDVGTAPVAAVVGPGGVITTRELPGRAAAEDELGFAVEGVAQVNLPILPGSLAWVMAGYTEGAPGLLGFTSSNNIFGGVISDIGGRATRDVLGGVPMADAVIVNGEIEATEVWRVGGGVRFQFTPQVRANIYGTYAEVDFADAANATITTGPVAFRGARAGFVDFQEGIIAGNVIWTPARNLDIGVEVLYQRVDFDGDIVITRLTEAGTAAPAALRERTDSIDDLITRIRVNRNF